MEFWHKDIADSNVKYAPLCVNPTLQVTQSFAEAQQPGLVHVGQCSMVPRTCCKLYGFLQGPPDARDC